MVPLVTQRTTMEVDVIVVGSGAAGLTTALVAAHKGLHTTRRMLANGHALIGRLLHRALQAKVEFWRSAHRRACRSSTGRVHESRH
jgi:pyruvate/2-oxoglutarate dehydrogenase complex dihydrolipoamide dehydrogenase (E3) component